MRDLPFRVHAGVGAAGGMEAGFLPGEFEDGFFYFFLHRGRMVLMLPARIGLAVIFNGYLPSFV
jgi:hypothetical protein